MKLMKCYPSNSSIMSKTIVFPSGKEIKLGSNGMRSYMVTSMEELNFLSKQRDIQLIRPTDREMIEFLEKLPEVPVVGVNPEEPKVFDVATVEEELLKDELIKRGYSVNKSSGSQETSASVSKISDIAIVKEFSKRSKANPTLLKAAEVELSDYNGDLESMSFEELRQLLAKLGYTGLRKSKG